MLSQKLKCRRPAFERKNCRKKFFANYKDIKYIYKNELSQIPMENEQLALFSQFSFKYENGFTIYLTETVSILKIYSDKIGFLSLFLKKKKKKLLSENGIYH